MNIISKLLAICCIAVLLAGCGSEEAEQTREEIIKQVNATGILTDKQAETLGNSKVVYLRLKGLTTITDQQAESLRKVEGYLSLNGLTSITDDQAEILSGVSDLSLNGLTTITDQQAESLGKVEGFLSLKGLTSITDEQAKSLSNVRLLDISEALQPLIDKYKKQ